MESQVGPNEKLLDRYQAIISRLAGNSSSFKGWAITVATAVIGFGAKDGSARLAYLALVPLILFYLLDAYYLASERVFRDRYNEIARSVDAQPHVIRDGVVSAMRLVRAAAHPATWAVYLALALTAVVIGTGWISLGGAPRALSSG